LANGSLILSLDGGATWTSGCPLPRCGGELIADPNGSGDAISALNHSHICALYDVGPNYLVMELCEGETLAARIKKGKLSIDEKLRYAVIDNGDRVDANSEMARCTPMTPDFAGSRPVTPVQIT
jgi:hypothetical protein